MCGPRRLCCRLRGSRRLGWSLRRSGLRRAGRWLLRLCGLRRCCLRRLGLLLRRGRSRGLLLSTRLISGGQIPCDEQE